MNNKLSEQNKNSEARGMLVQHQEFSGPLPPPEVLRQFDQVVPGAAERIIKMAEQQFAHRTELEKKVIDSDIRQSTQGQVLGFTIAIVGLLVSAIISIYGSELVGGFIGVGTLASLVGVFMYGSRARREERQNKAGAEGK
ncbi:MAG TPA: DUF2335 domain-containing protein [Candidatus Paceibacterota bacterium]